MTNVIAGNIDSGNRMRVQRHCWQREPGNRMPVECRRPLVMMRALIGIVDGATNDFQSRI